MGPRPRLFCQYQGQDFIFVIEAPRDQDLGFEDYINGLRKSGDGVLGYRGQYHLWGLGKCRKLPQQGPERSPCSRKRIFGRGKALTIHTADADVVSFVA